MMFEPLLGVVAQQQSNDAAGEGHDAGFGREVVVRRIMLGGGVDHQEARDGRQEKLSAKLLLDAGDGLGVQLAEREAVALNQLVELLDLPAQVVDLLHLRQGDLGSAQRCEQQPRIVATNVEADATQADRFHAGTSCCRRRMHEHAVVVAAAVLEHLNRIEGARLRHSDHELDACVAQSLQDFERRVAAIEHEHVALVQMRNQLQQLLPLARGARCDGGSHGEPADDVVQSRHQHLRAVAAVRHSEVRRELSTALQVMAHAIHREDSTPVPGQPRGVLPTNGVANHREQRGKQLRLQLAPCLAERRRGDRLRARQVDPRATRLLPECVEQQAVAATTSIGGHEQEECHQQFRRQRTCSREVRRLAATVPSPRRLEQLPDESHQRFVERRKYDGAGFGQPLVCQFADVSLRPRRIICRRLSSTHSITLANGLHAQSRTSFSSLRPATRRTASDDKVNGIGTDPREVEYTDRGRGDGKIDMYYKTEDQDTGALHFHIFQVHAPDVDKIRQGANRGEMSPGKLDEDVQGLYKKLTGKQKVRELNPSAAAAYEVLQAAMVESSPPLQAARVFIHIYPVCLKRVGANVKEKHSELRKMANSWTAAGVSASWVLEDIYTAEHLIESLRRNQSESVPLTLTLRIDHGFAGEANKQGRPILCFACVKQILDCYTEYGAGLFDGNLRYYLGRKTSVNTGIYQELQSPTGIKRFHKKNNGLTFTCDQAVARKKRGDGQQVSEFDLTRPQVINGGQTLVTIHEVYHRLMANRQGLSEEELGCLGAIEEMTLPVKIVPESDPRKVDDIAVASNTQNPLSPRTLRSSTALMRDSKRRFAAGNPSWYLETKDGEWGSVKEKHHVFQSLTGGRRMQDFQIAKTKRYRRIDNADLGVSLLAFHGHVAHAKKSRVFQTDYFDEVFYRSVKDEGWEILAAAPPTLRSDDESKKVYCVAFPGTATALLAYHVFRFWSTLTYPEGQQRVIAWEGQGGSFRSKYWSEADGWNVPPDVHSKLLEDKECPYHRERYSRACYLVLVYQTMRLLVRRYGRLTEARCADILCLAQFREMNDGHDPVEFRGAQLRRLETPMSTIGRILIWAVERMWLSRSADLETLGSPQQALLNRDWVMALSSSVDRVLLELKAPKSRMTAGIDVDGVSGVAEMSDMLPDLRKAGTV